MKKILLLLTLILISPISFAEEQCGIDSNGNIKSGDTEICENDVLNNIIKSSVYFDEEFETDSERTKIKKRQFVNAYKIFGAFILVSFGIALLIKITITIFKSATKGEKKEWIAILAVIALFAINTAPLYTKTGSMTLLDKLVKKEIELSIKGGTWIWSTILSLLNSDDLRKRIESNDRDEITYQQSQAYALNLVKSRLCNEATRQNVFLASATSLLDKEDLKNSAECAFGNKDGFTLTNISNVNLDGTELTNNVAYQQLTTAPATNIRNYRFMNSGLGFGMQSPKDGYCSKYGSFNCSTIKINNPSITGEGTKRLAEKIGFEETLLSVIESVNVQSDNRETIKNGFIQIITNTKEVNNNVIDEKTKNKLESLAYIYHTKIENYLLAGYVDIQRQGATRYVDSTTDLSTIRKLVEMSDFTAKNVINYQCSLYPSAQQQADKTVNKFNSILAGNFETLGDAKTYCAGYQDGVFYSYGKYFNLSDEEEVKEAQAYLQEQEKQALENFNALAETIYMQKKAIKESLLESFKKIQPQGFYRDLRQQGIITVGTSLMKVFQESNTSFRLAAAFDSEHFTFKNNYSEDNYLSIDNVENHTNFSKTMFSGGYNVADRLSDKVSKEAINHISTNNNANIQEVLIYTDQTTKDLKPGAISDTISDNAILSFSETLNEYVSSQGYKNDIFTDKKRLTECVKDLDCIKDITAHSYLVSDIETGQKFYSTSANIMAVLATINLYAESGIDSKNTGRVSSEITKFLNDLGGALVSLLILMMLMGVFLAFYFVVMTFIKMSNKIIHYIILPFTLIILHFMLPFQLLFSSTRKEAFRNIMSLHIQLITRLSIIVIAFVLMYCLAEVILRLKAFFTVIILGEQYGTGDIISMVNTAVLTLITTYLSFVVYKFVLRFADTIIEKTNEAMKIGNIASNKLTDKTEGALTKATNKVKK